MNWNQSHCGPHSPGTNHHWQCPSARSSPPSNVLKGDVSQFGVFLFCCCCFGFLESGPRLCSCHDWSGTCYSDQSGLEICTVLIKDCRRDSLSKCAKEKQSVSVSLAKEPWEKAVFCNTQRTFTPVPPDTTLPHISEVRLSCVSQHVSVPSQVPTAKALAYNPLLKKYFFAARRW